jgi:hypothetical protein
MTMVARTCMTAVVLVAAGCSVPCVDDGLLSMQHDQSCAQVTTTLTTTGTLPSMATLEPPPSTTLTTGVTDTTTTTGTTTGEGSSGGSSGGGVGCFNGQVDGDESDVDCGGDDCDPCEAGEQCDGDPSNCESGACNSGALCIDPELCTLPMGVDLLGSPQDQLGVVVDVVGDVDDDGLDDIVAVSWGASPRTFVIHGDPGLGADEFDLAAVEAGQGGFVVHSMAKFESIAPAGDFNEDGIDDFALGDGSSGRVFIVFGRAVAPPVPSIDLFDNDIGAEGVRFTGSGVGSSLAGGLDVDGDGKRDLVIGAPNFEVDTTYVVFGAPGLTDHQAMDIGTLVAGFQITSSFTGAGRDVALLPDLDGDGRAEVVVAAPSFLGGAGRVFVVFGKPDFGKVDLDEPSASFYAIGSNVPQELFFGQTLAAAGDVDGDGLHDIIASTATNDLYVIFGKAGGGDVDLDALGGGGFKIVVTGGNNGFSSVGGGSDINGDGRADLFVGAPYVNPQTLWVVFGKDTPGDVQTADVEAGVGGFAIRLPDPDAGFAESFGVGDPLAIGAATAVIGAPAFSNDEGLIKLVTLGLCP